MPTFKILTLIYGCLLFIVDRVSSGNVLSSDSILSPPNVFKHLLHREKRQGGGGIIPFRPLFVYRQQQKEQQEKWKEIEARKKVQQQLLQYQQYETIKQNQQYKQNRPSPTTYSTYSEQPTQYSAYNYPSSQYVSYYPSNYPRYEYETDPVYQKQPSSNYYQDYYDGYEYSSYF